MKQIHIECTADEHLVKKIGFTRRYITHHHGKSRVFNVLRKNKNQIALVDEDPDSPKASYEKKLKFIEESEGIMYYSDNSGNKIFYLKGKLEDWIIALCLREKINLSRFGLPRNSDDLHDQINDKLSNFDRLLDELETQKNPSVYKLKSYLV